MEPNAAGILFKTNQLYKSQGSLWQSFKKGDVEALENIYTQYFDLLCLYGRQFAPDDPLLVEDCIQDLFIQLYTNTNKHNLSDTNCIKFYLMKSIRRAILHAKKMNSKKNTKLAAQITDIKEPQIQACENEPDEINNEFLKKNILLLPVRQREAIYLRFYRELEFHEISDKMHLNIKSVYKLIYKGLNNLRHMYAVQPV